ncbi:hypothetical protein ACN28E_17890 [Archangium lansingense]|uniref:hypothetical protein n=1 Tax=Archangium lansingense TaxID=2995310 RepID=UPI003B7C44E2
MFFISPLGTGVILPAFVVGFELEGSALQAVAHLDDTPPWLLHLDQQAGGYCMSYPSVLGAVLRLKANLERGQNDPTRAVRAFKAMAEDPDMKLLEREFPALARLVYTRGDSYSKTELRSLGTFVRHYFDAPAFDSGIEAFVRCAETDPLDWFRGWRAFSCTVRPERAAELVDVQAVDESSLNSHNFLLDDTEHFEEPMLNALTAMGPRLGIRTPPRVFFLWENSD